MFGRVFGRQKAAKKELGSCVQTIIESYISYIQDLLGLCRNAHTEMTEADGISQILKAIAYDGCNLLVFEDCTTVDATVNKCQRFE